MLMLIKSLVNIVPILLSVAFITLMERKILGIVGLRLSPQKSSFYGILQPMADALKLSNKEINKSMNSSFVMFSLSSSLFLCSSLTLWIINQSSTSPINIKLTFMLILTILSINSILMMFMGWSSYSKYSLIGSMRSTAQTISYEAVLMMLLISIIWFNKSFMSQYLMCITPCLLALFPSLMILWLPTILAEMNRTPYDFSEGESELVSGFNTEFGTKEFSMIFIAEYSNIIFMMMLTSLLFTNKSFISFSILIIWVLWIRSVLPRMRFDKLMNMAWKILIPMSTMLTILIMFNI